MGTMQNKNFPPILEDIKPVESVFYNTDLEQHIESSYESKDPLECNIFDTASVNEKPFKCETCANSYKSKTNLFLHIKSKHEGKKLFKCDICDAKYAQRCGLNYHIAQIHE